MGGDISKRVVSGDPIAGYPAESMNYMMEGSRFAHRTASGVVPAGPPVANDKGVVHVKNTVAGDALPAYSILGLDDAVLFDEDDNLNLYRSAPTIIGSRPDVDEHVGKFCVTMEPLLEGRSGAAVALGFTYAKVLVRDEQHEYADITDNATGHLTSQDWGFAQIIRKPEGDGILDCVVRLGISVKPRYIGKVGEDVSKGSTTTVAVYSRFANIGGSDLDKGLEEATGQSIENCYARMGGLSNGDWVFVEWIDGGWEVYQAECSG